jgi:hypothetical protein
LKRTVSFARRIGTVRFEAARGQEVDIPLFPGIFKHAAPDELAGLLSSAAAVRKYTCEALRTAAWPILREFPREWLKTCIPLARLRPGRLRALEFLLESPRRPTAE